MNEIPWDVLPKTFQDAINFVRLLGHRYIWIDSLCIVQDDRDDWEREVAHMASIYQNSYLTLAATASRDGRGGLFFTQDERHHAQELKVRVGSVSYTVYCRDTLPHFIGPDLALTRKPLCPIEEQFPLLTRGWVYQERLLSPRVLHFGRQELVWECMEEHCCQCQSFPNSDGDLPKINYGLILKGSSPRGLIRIWKAMVSEYTRLNLSRSSDRLPAMAGIANHLGSFIGTSYLAGLWRESLVESLLWLSPLEGRAGRRTIPSVSNQRTPTWSWASIEGRIVFPPDGTVSIFFIEYSKIENIEHNISDDNAHIKTPSSATITLSGPAVSAVLRYKHSRQDSDGNSSVFLQVNNSDKVEQDFRQDYDFYHGDSSNHIPDGLGFRPDYDFWREGLGYVPTGTSLLCLLMGRVRFIGHDPYGREELEYALVLRSIDGTSGLFERLGMLRKHSECDVLSSEGPKGINNSQRPDGIFKRAETKTVTIV